MESYEQRVIDELSELRGKYERLDYSLHSSNINKMDKAELRRLDRQHLIMRMYIGVLEERVEQFK